MAIRVLHRMRALIVTVTVLALSAVAAQTPAAAGPAKGILTIIGTTDASYFGGDFTFIPTHGGASPEGYYTKLSVGAQWTNGTDTSDVVSQTMGFQQIRSRTMTLVTALYRPVAAWTPTQMRITAQLYDWNPRLADWVQVDTADTGWVGFAESYTDTD